MVSKGSAAKQPRQAGHWHVGVPPLTGMSGQQLMPCHFMVHSWPWHTQNMYALMHIASHAM